MYELHYITESACYSSSYTHSQACTKDACIRFPDPAGTSVIHSQACTKIACIRLPDPAGTSVIQYCHAESEIK